MADRSLRWWQVALQVLLVPLVLPAVALVMVPLGLLALASLPVGAALALVQRTRERRFLKSMQEAGRFLPWYELEPRLAEGRGTLIIEQAQKRPVRVWWTGDDVLRLAPIEPPATADLDILGRQEPHPFVAWCFEHYLARGSGTALLAVPPFALPPGLFFAEVFRGRFPKVRAIDTVYCIRSDAEPVATVDRAGNSGYNGPS